MARLIVGAVLGVVVGLVAGAALGVRAAQDIDESDLEQAAADADVAVQDLRGAVLSTGMAPRAYLMMTGELAAPKQPDALDRLVGCLAWAESRNDPNAYNRRSGASGLLQFLPGTWRSTPFAGSSIWNASAQWQAARWMIGQGRLHEWSTWRQCA